MSDTTIVRRHLRRNPKSPGVTSVVRHERLLKGNYGGKTMNGKKNFKIKELSGAYDIGSYRLFTISAPYSSKKYLFSGSETDAKEFAIKAFKNWSYSPKIREVSERI